MSVAADQLRSSDLSILELAEVAGYGSSADAFRITDIQPEGKGAIAAMEAGDFYASTGVTLEDVRFANGQLDIRIQPETGVTYTIEFIGAGKGKKKSEVLKTVAGTTATFKVTGSHQFVRARITSSKLKPNPFQEGDHEMAWTQPVR